jgi:hypothetical protein
MIRITCPNCQSRLNAKEELLGQTRGCPKCGTPILIAEPESAAPYEYGETVPLDDVAPEHRVEVPESEGLQSASHGPEHLDRQSRYVILDTSNVVAAWEDNGQGWVMKTRGGYVSVTRNQDKLATQGKYTLVELRLGTTDEGFRMQGIRCYRLAARWALTALPKGDDAILRKIEGPGSLSRTQKFALCQYIKEQFMREVWASVPEIHDYLLNADYHSPGVEAASTSGHADS